MITAAQARALSGLTIKERVEQLEPLIMAAIEKKERRIILRDSFWASYDSTSTPEWIAAASLLEELGYVVDFYYSEKQFVDMYTTVGW